MGLDLKGYHHNVNSGHYADLTAAKRALGRAAMTVEDKKKAVKYATKHFGAPAEKAVDKVPAASKAAEAVKTSRRARVATAVEEVKAQAHEQVYGPEVGVNKTEAKKPGPGPGPVTTEQWFRRLKADKYKTPEQAARVIQRQQQWTGAQTLRASELASLYFTDPNKIARLKFNVGNQGETAREKTSQGAKALRRMVTAVNDRVDLQQRLAMLTQASASAASLTTVLLGLKNSTDPYAVSGISDAALLEMKMSISTSFERLVGELEEVTQRLTQAAPNPEPVMVGKQLEDAPKKSSDDVAPSNEPDEEPDDSTPIVSRSMGLDPAEANKEAESIELPDDDSEGDELPEVLADEPIAVAAPAPVNKQREPISSATVNKGLQQLTREAQGQAPITPSVDLSAAAAWVNMEPRPTE